MQSGKVNGEKGRYKMRKKKKKRERGRSFEQMLERGETGEDDKR